MRVAWGMAGGMLLMVSTVQAARIEQTHQEMHMALAGDGTAQVEHRIGLVVHAGFLRMWELEGVEERAELEPVGSFATETAHWAGRVERLSPRGGVHLQVAGKRGLGVGRYTAVVRYRVDLVAEQALTRYAGGWVWTWASPVPKHGIDNARMVLETLPAPTAPRSFGMGDFPLDGGLWTVQRTPERDQLVLLKPHVSAGERVLWRAQLDSQALPALLQALPPRHLAQSSWRDRLSWLELGGGVLGVLLCAVLLRRKPVRLPTRGVWMPLCPLDGSFPRIDARTRMLVSLSQRLSRTETGLRATLWGQRNTEREDLEMRLVLFPKTPLSGLVLMEVACAPGVSSWGAGFFQLFVRVLHGSPAEAKLHARGYFLEPVGCSGEWSVRCVPSLLTEKALYTLMVQVARCLTERRGERASAWRGMDRRKGWQGALLASHA